MKTGPAPSPARLRLAACSILLLQTLLTLLPFLLPACRSKTALDVNGVPYTLVVAVFEGDNPGETTKVLGLVREYMQRKLNMRVEYLKSTDYTTVIEAMLAGKAHMAYLSPYSYVLATQKQHLIPLAAPGLNGKPFTYRSMIFTNPQTGLHSIEDVKARSHQLTLCFADPASTSGHLIPRTYLTSIGLDPKTAFKQTMFAGTHAASVFSVLSGKVDVGCAFQFAYEKMLRDGAFKSKDIVVLWQSDPIVEGPICMRPEVNAAFREKVKQALLDMPRDGREAFLAYMSMYFPKQADSLSYMPIQDSMFNGLRAIATSVGDLTPTKK
jgi:phosphonate transport system substrate-binding protein